MNNFHQRPRTSATAWVTVALVFLSALAQAGYVTFSFTNSVGAADTNVFRVIPVSGPIANADGSFTTIGLPIRITPASDGRATNYLAANNYIATNAYLGKGVVFRVPDDSTTNSMYDLRISGYNYFVTTLINTNISTGTGMLTNQFTTNAIGSPVLGDVSFSRTLYATQLYGGNLFVTNPGLTGAGNLNRMDGSLRLGSSGTATSNSFSYGLSSQALGPYGFAGGVQSQARVQGAIADGWNSYAIGNYAAAHGVFGTASGIYSYLWSGYDDGNDGRYATNSTEGRFQVYAPVGGIYLDGPLTVTTNASFLGPVYANGANITNIPGASVPSALTNSDTRAIIFTSSVQANGGLSSYNNAGQGIAIAESDDTGNFDLIYAQTFGGASTLVFGTNGNLGITGGAYHGNGAGLTNLISSSIARVTNLPPIMRGGTNHFIMGENALLVSTNYEYTTAIGRWALRYAYNSPNSVCIGNNTGQNGTNSSFVVNVGYDASQMAPLNDFAVTVGVAANETATNSQGSVSLGYFANRYVFYNKYAVNAGYQVAKQATNNLGAVNLGYQAAFNSPGNSYSVNAGYQVAENSITDNQYGVNLGYQAAQNAANNTSAVSIGQGAANNATNNSYSVNIGALAANSAKTENTGAVTVGGFAAAGVTNNLYAVNIGYEAGRYASNDAYGVRIGYRAGRTLVRQNSLAIEGNGTTYGSNNALIYGEFDTRTVTVNGAFNAASTTANTITASNIMQLATNYTAANFVPVAGIVKIVSSNGALYSVTQLSTNLIAGP